MKYKLFGIKRKNIPADTDLLVIWWFLMEIKEVVIARFANIMDSVQSYANGGKVLIGFQILLEAGLLPRCYEKKMILYILSLNIIKSTDNKFYLY